MIIDCIADLHGHFPKLEGGDLLIVAGDLTGLHSDGEFILFLRWLAEQNYKKKVFIAGNHDTMIQGPWPGGTRGPFRENKAFYDFDYLCDSGTEFEGLKIWGSPWTLKFKGQNPKAMAFTCDHENALAEKWALIPEDTDILVTHSPPFTILDMTVDGRQVGSPSLMGLHVIKQIHPRLWVFGHIHEAYGQDDPYNWNHTRYVNASLVNEHYQPVNKPIRVIL